MYNTPTFSTIFFYRWSETEWTTCGAAISDCCRPQPSYITLLIWSRLACARWQLRDIFPFLVLPKMNVKGGQLGSGNVSKLVITTVQDKVRAAVAGLPHTGTWEPSWACRRSTTTSAVPMYLWKATKESPFYTMMGDLVVWAFDFLLILR